MRCDELVDGAWYAVRDAKSWSEIYKAYGNLFVNLSNSIDISEYKKKQDTEWVRINPEDIFNEK